jgi:hypothetical protein
MHCLKKYHLFFLATTKVTVRPEIQKNRGVVTQTHPKIGSDQSHRKIFGFSPFFVFPSNGVYGCSDHILWRGLGWSDSTFSGPRKYNCFVAIGISFCVKYIKYCLERESGLFGFLSEYLPSEKNMFISNVFIPPPLQTSGGTRHF